jgi:hypothetical protein
MANELSSDTDALNRLLEGERGTVGVLVGLVSMATEAPERQALMVMGGQACQACDDLRGRLRALRAPIGMEIEPVLERILAPERLDDRLRAFSALRRELADLVGAALAAAPDPDTGDILATLRDVQLAQAGWAERRADEFAATRVGAESATPDTSGDAYRDPALPASAARARADDRNVTTLHDSRLAQTTDPAGDVLDADLLAIPRTPLPEGSTRMTTTDHQAMVHTPADEPRDPHPPEPVSPSGSEAGVPEGSRARRARSTNGNRPEGADPDQESHDKSGRRVRH